MSETHWQKIAPDVFITSLFSPSECQVLLDAIEDQGKSLNDSFGHPNSMQAYGTIVEDRNLSRWAGELINDGLQQQIVNLFGYLPHYDFVDHHAFLTVYGKKENPDLALHVDASHITLNVCLHCDAQGSELFFTGNRCRRHVDDVSDRFPARVTFKQGDAILHAGNQRHLVTPIDSGRRKNLVIWYRLGKESVDHSNNWIKARCPACNVPT